MHQLLRLSFAIFMTVFVNPAMAACIETGGFTETFQFESFSIPKKICGSESREAQLILLLSFLQRLNLPKTPSALDQNILPEKIWDHVSNNVHGFVSESSCKSEQMAYVVENEKGLIHLCPNFFNSEINLITDQAAIVLHEIQHMDKLAKHHPHTTCVRGRNTGRRNNCDSSFSEKGGFAVELEAIVRMLALPPGTFTHPQNSSAQQRALQLAIENFNEPIFKHDPKAILVIDNNNHTFILDPVTWQLNPTRSIDIQNHYIASRGVGLVLYPKNGENSFSINTLSPNLDKTPAAGGFANFYNELGAENRSLPQHTFNEGPLTGITITQNKLISYGGSPFQTEMPLPFTVSQSFSAEEFGSTNKEQLFLLSTENELYKASTIYGRVTDVERVENHLTDTLNIVFVNNQRIRLSSSGKIQIFQNNKWNPVRELADREFQFMSKPFYWSKILFN